MSKYLSETNNEAVLVKLSKHSNIKVLNVPSKRGRGERFSDQYRPPTRLRKTRETKSNLTLTGPWSRSAVPLNMTFEIV